MQLKRVTFMLIVILFAVQTAGARDYDRQLLRRVMNYAEPYLSDFPDSLVSNTYLKGHIKILRRNFTLAAIPTMFYLLRDGKREFFFESYSKQIFHDRKNVKTIQNILISTIYHRHKTLNNVVEYLSPQLYQTQLFKNGILSPVRNSNRKYYRYKTEMINDSLAIITFKSKLQNTQLLRNGLLNVNRITGRIISFQFEGEYDMVRFSVSGKMGEKGIQTLYPSNCHIFSSIKSFGNHLHATFDAYYNLPVTLPDTIQNSEDRELMNSLRPIKLNMTELATMAEYDSINSKSKNTLAKTKKKRKGIKYFLWNILGENMLHKIHVSTVDKRGKIRINPLLNPLYLGYNHRKGLTYKFDLRGGYDLTNNSNFSGRVKLGYAFRESKLFYTFTSRYNFNKRRNGYVELEFSNGNRIVDSRVLDEVKQVDNIDSINWDAMNLDYFKDLKSKVAFNYDIINKRLGMKSGFIIHRRSEVDKEGFKRAGRTSNYKSFAPFISVSWYPLTNDYPLVFTSQYEHAMKIFGGNFRYDKMEFDGQYIHHLPCLRSLSLRGGLGFYLDKRGETQFLDYSNFKENYIPHGWYDDWSGEFELLNPNWYNASDFYMRFNLTYESPLLLLTWMPYFGRIIEKERLYASSLGIQKLSPYTEIGYGFTTRVFSMGIFTGFSPKHFEGFGIKLGLELFENW